MKGRILILLLLIMATVGCKDAAVEYVYVYAPSVVDFYIDSGDETKASMVTNSATMVTVGILGTATEQESWDYATDDDFNLMRNLKLTYNETESSWDYIEGETAYWNNPAATDKFTFFGYSPYMYNVDIVDGETTTTTKILEPAYLGDVRYPTLYYDCLPSYTIQRDVLIAEPMIDIYRPSTNYVPLIFHHALTCVGFQVRECVARTDGKARQIKEVRITGVESRGSTPMNGDDISWTPASDSDTSRVYVVGTKCNDDEGLYYNLSTVSITDSYSTDFMLADGYLMLLPQTLGSGARVEIEFAPVEGETDGDVYEYELSGTWTPNKRVVYNITIGAMDIEDLDEMVYDWEKTLIKVDDKSYTLEPDAQDWTGSIFSPSEDLGVDSSGADGGASDDTYDWEGYVSPGFIQGVDTTTSGSSGTGASGTPDNWVGYILSSATTVGGSGSSDSGSTGTSGESADDWTGSIESATDIVGGSGSSSSGSSGTSGESADDWTGSIESGAATVGGDSSSGSGSSGTSGESADDWTGSIESGAATVGGSSSSSTGSSGTSGESAEDWTGSIESATDVVGGSGSSSSGSSGTSGESADDWTGSIESGAATVGGSSSSSTGTSGTSGESADEWTGSIESAASTVGGSSSSSTGTTGTSGDEADEWTGSIESAASTVGGSSSSGTGTAGTSGDEADDWTGSIESAASTVGGSSSSGTGTAGTTGESADSWANSVVTGGSLDIDSSSAEDSSQWGGNSTVVGGDGVDSGLTDTTIK